MKRKGSTAKRRSEVCGAGVAAHVETRPQHCVSQGNEVRSVQSHAPWWRNAALHLNGTPDPHDLDAPACEVVAQTLELVSGRRPARIAGPDVHEREGAVTRQDLKCRDVQGSFERRQLTQVQRKSRRPEGSPGLSQLNDRILEHGLDRAAARDSERQRLHEHHRKAGPQCTQNRRELSRPGQETYNSTVAIENPGDLLPIKRPGKKRSEFCRTRGHSP